MQDKQTATGSGDLRQTGRLLATDAIAIANAKDGAPEYGIKVHQGDESYEEHLVGCWWWTQNCDKLEPVRTSCGTFESEDLAWLDVAHFWFHGPSLPVTAADRDFTLPGI